MALASPVSQVRAAREADAKVIVPKSMAAAMVEVGAVSAAEWEKGAAYAAPTSDSISPTEVISQKVRLRPSGLFAAGGAPSCLAATAC
mmetsp:Transcript_16873/g.48688  ORF Transcript_16873/g.48688 Transcript_16873/m.48688 type:complete len:88 (-) Transcript_16873:140-403(-)